ncbi:MAG TPA: aldo/keto reductase [Microbacterium sp.]|uniref:aldo/keto reductase n=1 Tax=Microbacterium sp. TaxID=51671 RepID=UPI002CE7FC5D|nr:aldo/keto reductase [Microbacterium sp.]HWI32228.1 aldo/keto reductase [Microbacterium sp.]
MDMEYRVLGRSGLRVSQLSLGTLPFGGHQREIVGNTDLKEARRILDRAIDSGVNLIDTADVYGYGRAESTVGELIKGRRDSLIVSTKVRAVIGQGPNDAGLSRYHIMQGIEASLTRLGVDHIDLYQVHGWDGQTDVDQIMSTLDDLVRSGKVRYIGCSNLSAWHTMKALAAADAAHGERFVSQQIYYSILGREAEHELIPLSVDQGIGNLIWSPLAGGLLSGKLKRGRDEQRMRDWWDPPVSDPAPLLDVIEEVEAVAEEHGASVAQVAIAYLLTKPVTSIILGPRTFEHIDSALGSLSVHLTPEQIARLDDVSRRPLPYPYWHQARSMTDRLSAADETLLRGGPAL